MKRCLVIGNGPSLREIPNEFLGCYPTFGCNRIYLKFTPDVYVYVDPDAHKQGWLKDIVDLPCAKFIDIQHAHQFYGSVPLNCIHKIGFSLHPIEYVYAYFSATTVMLQLAVWMGYEEIGLIGVDHRYTSERCNYLSDGVTFDHFTTQYYPPGAIYNIPHLDRLADWHKLAKQQDAHIVNLTDNSALDVYEFEDWQSW